MILSDAHTHELTDNQFSLTCLDYDDYNSKLMPSNNVSIGMHPYNISKYSDKHLILFDKIIARGFNVGEIGLDKSKAHFEIQEYFFLKQYEIAKHYKKYFTLHSVRSYNEIYKIIKNDLSTKFIFHGYNLNSEFIKQTQKLNIYFSFSKNSLKSKKSIEALKYCPKDKLLIESDSNYPILESYKLISEILDVEIDNILNNNNYNLSNILI